MDAGILEGVTRNAVIEIARKAGYETHERAMTRHDVYTSDEVFLTGTAAEVIPVVKVDNRPIGTGKPAPSSKTSRQDLKSSRGNNGNQQSTPTTEPPGRRPSEGRTNHDHGNQKGRRRDRFQQGG